MTKRNDIISIILLLAAGLLAGCSDGSQPEQKLPDEIVLKTNVGQMMRGVSPRRVATYDSQAALQTEGSFRCVAYNAESDPLTAYISETTVNWNSSESLWEFNGGADHYYWPLPTTNGGEFPKLDFFAFMPATRPAYIAADPAYTAEHNVTFTCTNLPMVDSLQKKHKEFIYGMALAQNKTNAASGVPLTFVHPFARIRLQLAASHPDIVINRITFKSIKNNGSFVYNHSAGTSTWTPSGDATYLVFTDTLEYTSDPAITAIGEPFIVIPQTWEGEIEVNASWNDWGDTPVPHAVSTTIPAVEWQVGYSYAYTFYITPEDLTVSTTTFTEQW